MQRGESLSAEDAVDLERRHVMVGDNENIKSLKLFMMLREIEIVARMYICRCF